MPIRRCWRMAGAALTRNIHNAIALLRGNLRAKYGSNADMQLIDSLIKSELASRQMVDIEQVIGSWSVKELQEGQDVNMKLGSKG